MALEADAVDGDAAGLEVLDHGVDGVRLGADPVRAVVVVAELRARVGGAGGAEGRLDPVVAGALQVGVATHALRPVGERLVDHVPGVDLAPVVRGDLRDVVEHRLAQRGPLHRLRPGRLLRVPQQRVPAHVHAVRHGVVEDLVAAGVAELALGRLGRVPLHLVLRRDRRELAVEDPGVDGVAQPRRGHGRPEVSALRLGRRAERRGGLGRRRAQRDPGGDGEGQGGEGRRCAAPSPACDGRCHGAVQLLVWTVRRRADRCER